MHICHKIIEYTSQDWEYTSQNIEYTSKDIYHKILNIHNNVSYIHHKILHIYIIRFCIYSSQNLEYTFRESAPYQSIKWISITSNWILKMQLKKSVRALLKVFSTSNNNNDTRRLFFHRAKRIIIDTASKLSRFNFVWIILILLLPNAKYDGGFETVVNNFLRYYIS